MKLGLQGRIAGRLGAFVLGDPSNVCSAIIDGAYRDPVVPSYMVTLRPRLSGCDVTGG